MAKEKKLTDEQLAEEFTAMAVQHLDKLSPEEREGRIKEFSRRVATSCGSKRGRGTSSDSSCTRPSPLYVRERE